MGKHTLVRQVNPHLMCVLCQGYLIEATTIVDCLHSFCRSCLVKYLEKSKFCPICDVQLHKTNPLMSVRCDATLQRLVYKLVPGLYADEMARRRRYYRHQVGESSEPEPPPPSTHLYFSPEDSISLSLEYTSGDDGEQLEQTGSPHRRYLQCPAAVNVSHLKKFIRMKYDLGADLKVDVLYDDESLVDDFSLIDVAYTFSWSRTSPMRFRYKINKRMVAASGRPRRAAAKSAPPSKATQLEQTRSESEPSMPRAQPAPQEPARPQPTKPAHQNHRGPHSAHIVQSPPEQLPMRTDPSPVPVVTDVVREPVVAQEVEPEPVPIADQRVAIKRDEPVVQEVSAVVLPCELERPRPEKRKSPDEPPQERKRTRGERVASLEDETHDADDEDDDRSRVRPSVKEIKKSDRKEKKKNKKGKHHHHHHHRHHEKKRDQPAAAAIIKGDDLLKLKVKLTAIKTDNSKVTKYSVVEDFQEKKETKPEPKLEQHTLSRQNQPTRPSATPPTSKASQPPPSTRTQQALPVKTHQPSPQATQRQTSPPSGQQQFSQSARPVHPPQSPRFQPTPQTASRPQQSPQSGKLQQTPQPTRPQHSPHNNKPLQVPPKSQLPPKTQTSQPPSPQHSPLSRTPQPSRQSTPQPTKTQPTSQVSKPQPTPQSSKPQPTPQPTRQSTPLPSVPQPSAQTHLGRQQQTSQPVRQQQTSQAARSQQSPQVSRPQQSSLSGRPQHVSRTANGQSPSVVGQQEWSRPVRSGPGTPSSPAARQAESPEPLPSSTKVMAPVPQLKSRQSERHELSLMGGQVSKDKLRQAGPGLGASDKSGSTITVSKITAEEKRQLEAAKARQDETKRPSLEIMLVSGGGGGAGGTGTGTAKKQVRPPPPSIPLSRVKWTAGPLDLSDKSSRKGVVARGPLSKPNVNVRHIPNPSALMYRQLGGAPPPPPPPLSRIETMTRNIEQVAAGLKAAYAAK